MKQLLAFAFILGSVLGLSRAQGPRSAQNSPGEVLDQYFRLLEEGTIFTPEGWREMGGLFERSTATPRSSRIHVIPNVSKHREPWSNRKDPERYGLRVRGDRAEVDCGRGVMGTVDSALRYMPDADYERTMYLCRLVLTDTHWELGPDGKTGRAMKGSPEWRIEGALTERLATVDTVIAYVGKMRDKTTDPAVKKNVDRTIAILKRWR